MTLSPILEMTDFIFSYFSLQKLSSGSELREFPEIGKFYSCYAVNSLILIDRKKWVNLRSLQGFCDKITPSCLFVIHF